MRELQWPMRILFLMLLAKYSNGFIGINWGKRPADNGHIPSIIVDTLLRNGITDTRIFSNGENITNAFESTNITMSFTFSDKDFDTVHNVEDAKKWLTPITTECTRVQVQMRYIMVSDDPFALSKGPVSEKPVEMLQFLSEAIVQQGGNQPLARATIPHSTDVLKIVNKPSEGEFRDEIKDVMKKTVDILKQYQAPFVIEIMPMNLVKLMKKDINFALYNDTERFHSIKDIKKTYTNVFDFWYDTFYHALRKLGAPKDLDIVVGKIGWPSDGSPDATPVHAGMFYKGFLKKIRKGTPMRPRPVDVFLETLIDENLQADSIDRQFMGIYQYDGTMKYPIDLAGKGGVIITFPPPITGLTFMPRRYCIYNYRQPKALEASFVQEMHEKCCSIANCSPLDMGWSCSHLNDEEKLSYMYNLVYQLSGQIECYFRNTSIIVNRDKDPSVGTCTFPIGLLGAEPVVIGRI